MRLLSGNARFPVPIRTVLTFDLKGYGAFARLAPGETDKFFGLVCRIL